MSHIPVPGAILNRAINVENKKLCSVKRKKASSSMRNLQIILWALIAAAYLIVGLFVPTFPWWARAIIFIVLWVIVTAIFQYLRRRQSIQEYTMEETGVIGLNLGATRKS